MCNKILSIIAPCYNGEKYIERFLNSIVNQTYPFIELIVINDGSSDNTGQILKRYESIFEKKGINFKYFFQENRGIGGAINNALKKVTGDYLTWFGTDDFALPTYAEELVNFLNLNEDYAVVRNDGYIVKEDNIDHIVGNMAESNNDKHNPYLFENAILEKDFHFGYSVIRMSAFDKVNPKREIYPSRQGQNWQLLLPIFYKYKAAFYEKPLYCVVDNIDSVSRTPHKTYEGVKSQNLEYEKILINVLNSMEIENKKKYYDMVKIKYIRRRMYVAFNFNKKDDVISEYSKLKKLKRNNFRDFSIYIRTKIPILNKILNFVKNYRHN